MSAEERVSELILRRFTLSSRERWFRRFVYLRRTDERALALLRRIEAERPGQANQPNAVTNPAWLLKYRDELRWAVESKRLFAARYYLASCPAEMVPLGVWLWGQCTDRFRLYGLTAFCHHSSPQIRRHVAKTFRRVEAWALLDEMAAAYPDDAKIQWYAKSPTSGRSFAKRLKNFTAGIDRSHADEVVTPSQMPYWARDSFWSCTPPKSVEMIRRMLRRIQHWVRWGTT